MISSSIWDSAFSGSKIEAKNHRGRIPNVAISFAQMWIT
jgi:hypothetical protein